MSFSQAISRRAMSAVARTLRLSKPGQLSVESASVPTPGSSQVVVKMLAAPVNELDAAVASGRTGKTSGPLGTEGVGVVTNIGSGVNGVNLDDWVVPANSSVGTFSEYVVADATDVQVIPNDIGVANAALLGGTSCTAHRLLSDFGAEGVIVQNAANSPVGQAVIQIAKARGLKTINIIPDMHPDDSAEVVQFLKDLGGDIVVNESYSNTPLFAKVLSDLPAPSLGINGAGGASATTIARTIAEGANLVTYGGSAPVQVPTSVLVGKGITLQGFSLARYSASASAADRAAMVDEVATLVQDGALKANVSETTFTDFIAAGISTPASTAVAATLVTM